MELEIYEANLADIALQEQTFYETKPTFEELQMASQLLNSTLSSQNGHSGTFNSPSTFPILQPILNTGKGKKKKSVKFLTYVQVSCVILIYAFNCTSNCLVVERKIRRIEYENHNGN